MNRLLDDVPAGTPPDRHMRAKADRLAIKAERDALGRIAKHWYDCDSELELRDYWPMIAASANRKSRAYWRAMVRGCRRSLPGGYDDLHARALRSLKLSKEPEAQFVEGVVKWLVRDAVCAIQRRVEDMQVSRLIIAGSRHGVDPDLLHDELRIWVEEHGMPDVVLCGEADGVDQQGKSWALSRGVRVESYPADWHTHGKAAGPIRNRQMAAAAQGAIIFAPDNSRGSNDMERAARRAGLKVERVIP